MWILRTVYRSPRLFCQLFWGYATAHLFRACSLTEIYFFGDSRIHLLGRSTWGFFLLLSHMLNVQTLLGKRVCSELLVSYKVILALAQPISISPGFCCSWLVISWNPSETLYLVWLTLINTPIKAFFFLVFPSAHHLQVPTPSNRRILEKKPENLISYHKGRKPYRLNTRLAIGFFEY